MQEAFHLNRAILLWIYSLRSIKPIPTPLYEKGSGKHPVYLHNMDLCQTRRLALRFSYSVAKTAFSWMFLRTSTFLAAELSIDQFLIFFATHSSTTVFRDCGKTMLQVKTTQDFLAQNTTTIPAEDGIPEAVNYLYIKYIRSLWMPAFAGMTVAFSWVGCSKNVGLFSQPL